MNITTLLQGASSNDQIGYEVAFSDLVAAGRITGYRSFPFRSAVGLDAWRRLWLDVIAHMTEARSDVLICQFFHGMAAPDPAPYLRKIADLPQRPLVVTTCGDGFGPLLAPPPRVLVQAARNSNLTFASSMGRLADRLVRDGARRVALMPLAACDVRFGSQGPPRPDKERPFDVVFVGSRPGGRNPSRHLYWSGRRRIHAVTELSRRYGTRFGLFGKGWEGLVGWQGPVPYQDQLAATQLGKVVYGGYPGSRCDYYASDRVFIAALSGVPLVDHAVERVDRLLVQGSEFHPVRSVDDTLRAVERLLSETDEARRQLGLAARKAVIERHMISHRVKSMVECIEEVRDAERAHRRARPPQVAFFHPGVDQSAEERFAFRGW